MLASAAYLAGAFNVLNCTLLPSGRKTIALLDNVHELSGSFTATFAADGKIIKIYSDEEML